MRRHGAAVFKVNFNLGDLVFYPFRSILYRKSLDQWPLYLERILRERHITEIVLFGDCRPYHRVAVEIARRFGLRVFVFEEGYLRPYWITLEEGGVNGYSRLPGDPEFYRRRVIRPQTKVKPFAYPFERMAFFSAVYSLAELFGGKLFPGYDHHRELNPLYEAFAWVRSAWRRRRHNVNSKQVRKRCKGPLANNYYLLPLQVHNDAQIMYHSPFESVEALLDTVLESFSRYAPEELFLVIKHHPMDRGYSDYSDLIKTISRSKGVYGRVIYTWDSHLPTILKNALGVVTANSTVGLQGLFHKTPVKVLGKAVYDIPGLTFSGKLDEFWSQPTGPDPVLYQKFREYLLATVQFRGSFAYPPTRELLDHWSLPRKTAALYPKDLKSQTTDPSSRPAQG